MRRAFSQHVRGPAGGVPAGGVPVRDGPVRITVRTATTVAAAVAGFVGVAGLAACTGSDPLPVTPSSSTSTTAGPATSTSSAAAPASTTAPTSTTTAQPGLSARGIPTRSPGGPKPGGDVMPSWDGPKRSLPMSTAEIATGRPRSTTTAPVRITADAWCTYLVTPTAGGPAITQGTLCATDDPRRVPPG